MSAKTAAYHHIGEEVDQPAQSFTQRLLEGLEKVGNRVPHPAIIFLILMAIVIVLSHIFYLTGAIPKWAIFAPIFVPLLMRLGVAPEAVLAAYRVGDSPVNSISPMNAYFALIVSFAAKYQKDAGLGTVIALMLPYVIVLFVLWPILLAVWHVLKIPWGL
jgi:aminobenzoyl-glutamate transport protein